MKISLNYNLILFGGLIFVSLPGILLAEFSINPLDEPYQILRAYDWQNSVYSPLSAWLGNIFGSIVDWRYLFFRYFVLLINFVTILVVALYALKISTYPRRTLFISWFAGFFYLSYHYFIHYLYGWDVWTNFFL